MKALKTRKTKTRKTPGGDQIFTHNLGHNTTLSGPTLEATMTLTIKQKIKEIWMWAVAIFATIVIAAMLIGGVAIIALGVIRWLT